MDVGESVALERALGDAARRGGKAPELFGAAGARAGARGRGSAVAPVVSAPAVGTGARERRRRLDPLRVLAAKPGAARL